MTTTLGQTAFAQPLKRHAPCESRRQKKPRAASLQAGSMMLAARAWAALTIVVALTGCALSAPGGGASASASGVKTAQTGGQADGGTRVDRAGPDGVGAGNDAAQAALPPNDLTPQILFQLLAAEVAAQRGQGGSAAATYLALARQTRDPRLAKRATELALADRSLEQAMQAAQLWSETDPSSPVASQTREMLLLGANRLSEAEPLLIARRDKARKEDALPGFYRQIQRTLSRVSDHKEALALFDRLVGADSALPEARQAAAELARAAGQADRAAAEARKAYALTPDEQSAAVTAARYLSETENGAQQAAGLLREFLERHPDSIDARFHYARLLASMDDIEAAREQMERALKAEPDSPAILFSLAQMAYQAKRPQLAEPYLLRYVSLPATVHRDNGPAYLFLAQIEEDRKQIDKAIAWLGKITRGEQFLPALIQRSRLLAGTDRLDEARKLLQTTVVSTTRERVRLVGAEAQLLREAKQLQPAFAVLDAALVAMPDNVDLLYDHAMAAERLNRLDLMEASLRKLIELRPDNAHAYNALGYTLADRNIRLDEAQALIEKALELMPDEAHIIDSLGWVLFRRGELARSLEQLEKAFALKPEAEIAVHLAEVLWSMGRKDEARRRFAQAREIDPNNESLLETLARLKVEP